MSKMVNASDVGAFINKKLAIIKNQADTSAIRGLLVQLRRGVGRQPGDMPVLWGIFLQDLPEHMMGENEPSKAEWAIYTSLTLFALHQQGRELKNEFMHKSEMSLGRAVSLLSRKRDAESSIIRRFNAVATSSDMKELSHHMRGMVQLLRSEGIGLDYVRLATDLYLYQFASNVSSVRLHLGQDLYRYEKEEEQ